MKMDEKFWAAYVELKESSFVQGYASAANRRCPHNNGQCNECADNWTAATKRAEKANRDFQEIIEQMPEPAKPEKGS
jgi:hypothetical protein